MQHRLRSYTATIAAAAALSVGFAACGSDSESADTTEATVEATDDTAASDTTDVDTTEAAATTTKAPTTSGRATTTTEEARATTTVARATTSAATATTVVEGGGAVPDGWVAYTSPSGYSVAFPDEPSEQTQNAPLPDGSTLAMVIVSAQSGSTFFGAASGEYPAGSITDVSASLQGAQDQAIENVNGTLISSEDIMVQDRPGRQFSASVTSNGQQGTLIQRVILDGDKIFQNIVVGGGTILPTDEEVSAFFDSFEFTS